MEFKDKATFYDRLFRAHKKVGRTIGREETDVFFEDLKGFPLELVLKGIDRANQDRDYDDVFQRNKMLETSEIRKAIEKVLASPGSKRSGCDKCEGTTWILPEPIPAAVRKKLKVSYTEPAKRCECWHGAINSKKKETGGKK